MSRIEEITPEDVEALLSNPDNKSIIDVREHEEVAFGKIPGARHIPLGELQERTNEIEKDKEHIIVCRSGNRSGRATEFLKSMGYKVKNMVGGMNEWKGDMKRD